MSFQLAAAQGIRMVGFVLQNFPIKRIFRNFRCQACNPPLSSNSSSFRRYPVLSSPTNNSSCCLTVGIRENKRTNYLCIFKLIPGQQIPVNLNTRIVTQNPTMHQVDGNGDEFEEEEEKEKEPQSSKAQLEPSSSGTNSNRRQRHSKKKANKPSRKWIFFLQKFFQIILIF